MPPTRRNHPGTPGHADHDRWLCELGRATYAAAMVAGICFDLARVFGEVESAEMYDDPLGALIRRLRPLADQVPDLPEFIEELDTARIDRNDLLHALPVHHGLHRRRTKDPGYVRTFYEVEDLEAVTSSLTAAAARGNELLYQDGGAAARRWRENLEQQRRERSLRGT